MPPAQSTLLNSLIFDFPDGPRRFNLYQGDICDSRSELMAISSHASQMFGLSGQVLRVLATGRGIHVTGTSMLVPVRDEAGTHVADFTAPASDPLKRLLVVRIPGASAVQRAGGEPMTAYREAVWSLFAAVAALELRGEEYRSLALPLLGARRSYPPLESIRVLLELAERWLEQSRSLREVDLYLFEVADAVRWSEAMDTALQRTSVFKKSDVSKAMMQETRAAAEMLQSDPIVGERCRNLLHGLDQEPLSLQLVASLGRSLAESIVTELCRRGGMDSKQNFCNDIDALRPMLAPWVITYFHTLRVLGNEGVHSKNSVSYSPAQLEADDLLSILTALTRVMSIWRSQAVDPSSVLAVRE